MTNNQNFIKIKKEIFQEKNIIVFEKLKFSEEDCNYLSKILSNLNLYKKSLIFKNCEFKGNLRIDNIKCYELNFENCNFLEGGGLKNRGGSNKLSIKKFIFKPFRLEGDFVIDLGEYVEKNGLIHKETGIIEHIEFENHQIGTGRVFFVGLNDKLKEGNFRNRILDNVIFENSNLKNCFFLNSKIDKTEFRNVEFNKSSNISLFSLQDNKKEGVLISFLIGTMFLFPFFYSKSYDISLIMVVLLDIFLIIISLSALDVVYTFLLEIVSKLIDNKSNTFLNKHISTADERLIINQLKERRSNDYSDIINSLKSLKHLYDELALNFSKTDKQLWGEFMYSSKYWSMIIAKPLIDFLNVFPNRINHLINGFGRRWFRSLFFLLLTSLLIFPLLFLLYIKPNKDYISTPYTPYFLVVGIKENNLSKKALLIYDYNLSFFKYQHVKNFNNSSKNLYGYDNRYNFSSKNQYVLKLKNDFSVGLCKSLSNILYPFNYENKKWFQNLTPKAYIFSFIESIILWLLIIGFLRAVWNTIKY